MSICPTCKQPMGPDHSTDKSMRVMLLTVLFGDLRHLLREGRVDKALETVEGYMEKLKEQEEPSRTQAQ